MSEYRKASCPAQVVAMRYNMQKNFEKAHLKASLAHILKHHYVDTITFDQLRSLLKKDGVDISSVDDQQLAVWIDEIGMHSFPGNEDRQDTCNDTCGVLPPGFIRK